jgi:hypothetical protein
MLYKKEKFRKTWLMESMVVVWDFKSTMSTDKELKKSAQAIQLSDYSCMCLEVPLS